MSYLDEAMEIEVVMLDQQTIDDGEGGHDTEWVEGAHFKVAIRCDNSMQAKIAEKQGVTSVYTITAPVNAKLEFHDVLKRVSDGKIFRVTSDSDDKKTPKRATFQFVQVSAEEWSLSK